MSLQFYFGASGAGKSHEIYEDVIQKSIQSCQTEYLIIVPDQFTMQTQKELVCRHPNRGILNIDVLSFGRLAHRILTEVGCEEKELLDDTGKCLLLRNLVAGKQEEMPILGMQLRRPGYIQEVKSVFSEFMQYQIEPGDVCAMAKTAENRGLLKRKLEELGLLYESFLSEIRQSYATKEELPLILKRCIPKSTIIKRSVVVFDGFTGFTPVQNQVIQELLCCAKEVVVTLVLDERTNPYRVEGEENLFWLSQKTVVALMKLAEQASVGVKEARVIASNPVYRYQNNEELAHLERNLFRYPVVPYTKENKNLRIIKVFSLKEEVKWISYEIMRLVQTEGYAYRDFAVVTGDLENYQDEIREEFLKYKLPFFMDTTRCLKLNPYVEFLRSAIKIMQNDFAYADVFRFLRCGISPLKAEETDELENYVNATGIRRARMWAQDFSHFSRELMQNEEKLLKLNEYRERFYESLKELRLLEELPTVTVRERVMALYRFTLAFDVENRLREYRDSFDGAGDLAKAKEYDQIYKVVLDLLNQFSELLGDEVMGWKEFADILDAGIAELRVGTIPQTVDRVLVGDIERTRLGEIKTLFFMGVNDGIIPINCSKGGILSQADREYLSRNGRELTPTARQQIFIQRLYLYLNMTKPIDRLYLTYSCVDADGKSIRPSYLLDEIKKLFPKLEEEEWKARSYREKIHSSEDGIEQLSELLRGYAEETLSEDEKELLYELLGSLNEQSETAEIASSLKEMAFSGYCAEKLPQELANKLYGEIVAASISSMERFAACEYAHYLQYGLKLREPETYDFAQVDLGNVYHEVLEEFGNYLEEQGKSFPSIAEEECDEAVDEIVSKVAAAYGGSVLLNDARNTYRVQQLKRILKRTVHSIKFQLSLGEFQPFRYEVPFEKNLAFRGDEGVNTVHFRGRIDRIDLCEADDKVYVKVVDYKSGNPDFNLEDLYYGLQLQLPIYLEYAMKVAGTARKGKRPIASAMLYYRIQDPVADLSGKPVSAEEIEAGIREALIPKGVVMPDETNLLHLDGSKDKKSLAIPTVKPFFKAKEGSPARIPSEVMSDILNYAVHKTDELCKQMLEGNIALNPYEKDNRSACTYCAYRRNCGFDEKIPGFERRELKDNQEEILKEMSQGGKQL